MVPPTPKHCKHDSSSLAVNMISTSTIPEWWLLQAQAEFGILKLVGWIVKLLRPSVTQCQIILPSSHDSAYIYGPILKNAFPKIPQSVAPSGTSNMNTFPSSTPSHTSFASHRPTTLIYPSISPAPEYRFPSNSPTSTMYPTKKKSNAPSIEISYVPSHLPSLHPSSNTIPILSPEIPPENDTGWNWMDNSVLVTTMWIFFLSVMIVFPFIGTSDRRTVCRRRIVERRWNVEMRNDDSGAVDSVNAQRWVLFTWVSVMAQSSKK